MPRLANLMLFIMSATAWAAPGQRLGVLSVSSPTELQAVAVEVTLLLEKTAASKGYQVTSAETLREKMGDEAFAQAQGCRGKPECVTRRLEGHALDHIVTGVLERDETRYRLRLALVQLRPPSLISSAEREVPIASRRFAQEVGELVPRLLRGEEDASGTLHLKSTEKDVEVSVDGVPVGRLPVTLHPRPGKHLVRATKPNHLPVERWVQVESSKETTEELPMLLAPGAVAEQDTPGIEVAHQGGGLWLGRPWPFWVAAGVTVASAATAAGFAIDASQRAARLRDSFNPATGIYGEPRSEALRGQQSAKMANVAFIVAGAAAVTTAVLYVALPAGGGSSPNDKKAQAWLSPSPGGAAVGLTGEF